jgi:hypothetical protein
MPHRRARLLQQWIRTRHYLTIGIMPAGAHQVEEIEAENATAAVIQLRDLQRMLRE